MATFNHQQDDTGGGVRSIICFIVLLLVIMLAVAVSWLRAAEVRLKWDANPETDIACYKVWYGTASGNYSEPITITGATRAILADLDSGTLYYAAVQAVNTAGVSSEMSDEISFIPPSSPPPPPPVDPPAYLRFAIIRERTIDGWQTFTIQQIEEVIVPNPAPASMQWRDRIVQLNPGDPLPVR